MLNWKKRNNRYICSPSYMLITVEFEPSSYVEIMLFADEKMIKSRKINTKKSEYDREDVDKMVKDFCKTFASMRRMYTDLQLKQYARELSSVYNILGLKIWENKYKKKWGLKE